MSIYMTEDEQLDAIKKWWQRYQRPITRVLAIVLLLTAGYRYWNWHVDKVNQQASQAYERLMVAVSQKDNKAMQSYAKQLSIEYSKTVYGDVARLAMAHYFVMNEEWAHAREELTYVAEHSKMPALKQVAALRVARIDVSEKAYDQALRQLDQVSDAAYLSLVNELKGDILVANGRSSEAKVLYQEARLEAQKRGVSTPVLDMKMNEN